MKAIILLASALNLAGQVGLIRPQTSPAEAQAQMTGKASIEGTVVDSLTGQPVRKAIVMLNGRIGLNAVTDTSGHFAFRLLPAGRYTIRASNDNYPESRNPVQVARTQFFVTVGEDEQKRDVHLKLVPGASVSGRVVDEEDNPMRGCGLSAMQFHETESGPAPMAMESAQSDDKGEYRIRKLPPGKYSIMARCTPGVPLPHALVLRSATSDLPSLVYPSRFYPGVADLAAAARVAASAGADVMGIDFKMSPAAGLTIRGHAAGLPSGGVNQVMLESRDPSTRQWQLPWERPRARINGQTGEFEIRNVLPGSYDLVASSSSESRFYFARVPVEVGATKPHPVDLELAEAPPVSGIVSIDGDATPPTNSLKFRLTPLDRQLMMGPPPRADVQSDGSFSFVSVVPGHWRLDVDGATYLKSVTRGYEQVSPNDFEIGVSAVSLKIVLGTKWGQIDGAVSDTVSSAEPIYGFLWAAGESTYIRNFAFNNRQPQQVTNLPPGKYYGCAIATAQFSLSDYALRKALEGRCAATELDEGGHATMQMPLISGTELEQLIDKLEQ
jgi:protocatechuate 3,4-dioxygenase beta subunit